MMATLLWKNSLTYESCTKFEQAIGNGRAFLSLADLVTYSFAVNSLTPVLTFDLQTWWDTFVHCRIHKQLHR